MVRGRYRFIQGDTVTFFFRNDCITALVEGPGVRSPNPQLRDIMAIFKEFGKVMI